MYKTLSNFLNDNNIIYNLQFRFRQQYSTFNTLINVTDSIRKADIDRNIGFGLFIFL